MGTSRVGISEQNPEIGFHSINVPSEWGLKVIKGFIELFISVSIQLMSPASGDLIEDEGHVRHVHEVSIQLMSPASGDINTSQVTFTLN